MRLQNSTGEILCRRKVYYVTIFDKDGKMVAFLGSELHYVSQRTDAALFDTEKEAEELLNEAEINGICNTIDTSQRWSYPTIRSIRPRSGSSRPQLAAYYLTDRRLFY